MSTDAWRQGASWPAVKLSVATAVVQVPSIAHGGTHVTTRQRIGPMHGTCWLHWP